MPTKNITQMSDALTFSPVASGSAIGYVDGKVYLVLHRNPDGSVNDALSTFLSVSATAPNVYNLNTNIGGTVSAIAVQ